MYSQHSLGVALVELLVVIAIISLLPAGADCLAEEQTEASAVKTDNAGQPESPIEVVLGEPAVVAVSRPGENRWGVHQFPTIYRLDEGRLAVTYSAYLDTEQSYGEKGPVYASSDAGKTWQLDKDVEALGHYEGGPWIVFPDGEAIRFPRQRPLDAAKLNLPKPRASETTHWKEEFDWYALGDLPKDLQEIPMVRRKPGQNTWTPESARLDVPNMAIRVKRVDTSGAKKHCNIFVQPGIQTIFFWTITPDGAVLVFEQSKLFKDDGTFVNVWTDVVLRSNDRGRNWRLWGIAGYSPDEAAVRRAAQPYLDDPQSNYNRLWGGKGRAPVPNLGFIGFMEPGVVSFGDGRMVCVMRSHHGSTLKPMFVSRSKDWGKTWSVPEVLAPYGVMPRMVLLECGVIALSYGRPGMHLLFSSDDGQTWHTPITLLPRKGEKAGGMLSACCGYSSLLVIGPDRFLIAYSDFKYVNKDGQQCKAIKVREVRVKVQTR